MAGSRQQKPLHERIYQDLRGQIEGGELPPGSQLPTELEIADEYSVSRGTARQAITRLVNEGTVDRTAGRGTFVSSRRLTYAARELLGFGQQIRATGRTPSSSLVELSLVSADAYAKTFGFAPGLEKLVSIERVRKADGEPVALEQLLLPWPRFAGLRDMDVATLAVYDTLENLFGVHLRAGEFQLDVEDLNDRQSELLEEPAGAAAFLMLGTVFDQDDQPIVGVKCYYRRSRYSFHFTIPRESHSYPNYTPPRPVMSH